ncbi:MAG: alanine racemase [Chthoniobacteraceae bacterium]
MILHPPHPSHRTWAEIDGAALAANARTIREHTGAGLIAVVKANAYGHGFAQTVPALAPEAAMFAVANVGEALEVHALAPETQVLLLGPAAPGERAEVVAHGFIPMVSSVDEAAAYSQLSRTARTPIHLKLDTGMGRVGLWHEEAVGAVREIRALHGVEITGIASHLAIADEDADFTREQLADFHRVAKTLREEEGLAHGKLHVCNSAGAIVFPGSAGDLVRAGLALFGSSPIAEFQPRLRVPLTLKTQVVLVRDVPAGRSVSYGRTFTTERSSRLATLAVGYADGYRRHLSGRGAEVLIRGRRCAVLGRVTMDQIIADVTALDACECGDVATLMGAEIPAAELAQKAGTIPWDIFTGLGTRVARLALDTRHPTPETPAS